MKNHVTYRPSHGTKASSAWSELQIHLSERLNDLRRDNDSTKLTEVETATLRGKIAEVKRLIDLDADLPEVTVSED